MCDWSEFVREYCLRSLDTLKDASSGAQNVKWFGIFVEIFLFIVCSHVISTLGDSFMSPAFESLSLRRGGLGEVLASVFISINLSLPETMISFVSAIKGEFSTNHSLAISTILGSGWISILLIPGIVGLRSRVMFPGVIIARDIVFYAIMMLLLHRTIGDEVVSVSESLLFLLFYGLYFVSVSLTHYIERGQRTQRRESRVLVQLAPLQTLMEERELLERLPVEMALSHEMNSEEIEPVSFPRPPVPSHSENILMEEENEFSLRPLIQNETFTSRVLGLVCVKSVPGTDSERLYMLSLVNVFVLQLLLSSVITAVSNRWVELVYAGQAKSNTNVIGSVVVGLFSKLTDILHALSVSTPYAGYHVVTSSVASQIFAIGVGLGLTWFINGAVRGSTHIDNTAVRLNVHSGLIAVSIFTLFALYNFREGKTSVGQPRLLVASFFILVLGFVILSIL